MSFDCFWCCSYLRSRSHILLIAVFESAKIWPDGSLRISPCVAVRAFAQLTGKDDAAMGYGDGDGGKDGDGRKADGNYFCYPDDANPPTLRRWTRPTPGSASQPGANTLRSHVVLGC